MIIEELNRRGKRYEDDQINVKSLFFADDGLLLSNSIDDAAEIIQIVTQISRTLGLEINKTKINIIKSAHHFQLTLVLFTYQILLGNSKTRDTTLVWSYLIYRKLLTQ